MSPPTLGDVMLGIFPSLVWLIGALCAVLAVLRLAALALRLAERGRAGRARRARRERDLPALARAMGRAEAETQAISMRHFTGPDLGTIARPGCRWCTDPAYTRPEDCRCTCRCEGIAWCAAWWPASPVPIEWERKEGTR